MNFVIINKDDFTRDMVPYTTGLVISTGEYTFLATNNDSSKCVLVIHNDNNPDCLNGLKRYTKEELNIEMGKSEWLDE